MVTPLLQAEHELECVLIGESVFKTLYAWDPPRHCHSPSLKASDDQASMCHYNRLFGQYRILASSNLLKLG